MMLPGKVKTPEDYQVLAARTRNKGLTEKEMLSMLGLGIAGEAGEVADYIKKVVFHEHPLDKSKLIKELGDVQWYLSNLADIIGATTTEIMQQNIDKLRERYPEGFTVQASLARADDPPPNIVRVSGETVCETCDKRYRSHPFDEVNLDHEGNQYLRVACDGRLLKL